MPQIRQTERRLKVLEFLRNGTTETDIAPKLNVSRETIVRDVYWLRQNILYDFKLITNEILDKLHSRINEMENRDLINFLGKLIPQKIEAHEEIDIFEKREIDVTENEDEILSKASAILSRKERFKPIH